MKVLTCAEFRPKNTVGVSSNTSSSSYAQYDAVNVSSGNIKYISASYQGRYK